MVDEDIKALAREVRYLRDRLAIADCISAYCRALDRLDSDLLRSAYHPDVIDRHGPFMGDREAFVPWAIELQATFPLTHHNVTTHSCEIDGDRANAESYCLFFAVMPDGKTLGAGAARYIDELERRDGEWALSKRIEVMEFGYELARSDWAGGAWGEVTPRRDRQDLSYQRPLDIPAPLASGKP